MANSRVSRGRRSQLKVTEWFRDHGWTGAENTPASISGMDITGMPSYAPEIKATRDGSLTGAMKQARKNASEGETPFVVWRPDGYGEERIGEWLCVFTLEDATNLMRQVEEFQEELRDEALQPIPCGHDPERVWFSRSICPEPCGSMHYHCEECGRITDRCALEDKPTRPMHDVLLELAAELQRAIKKEAA